MAPVSKGFVDKTLWPEYQELDKELTKHLDAIAERIINETIFPDTSDAEELVMLPSGQGD